MSDDIGTATASGIKAAIEDYSVAPETTDGITGQETSYVNSDWSKQLGYYKDKENPALRNAIDIKSAWTLGKGYTADEITTLILSKIKGFGKDTFNSILENLDRVKQIGGDSFAHIIVNDKGFLINLKPLPPETIRTVADKFGLIIRYEMISKVGEKIKVIKTFEPEEIFHLCRNRVADEIHGVSLADSLEWIILARSEAMTDWKRVMHRNVEPLWIFHLNTDNQTKINALVTKYNKMRKDGENMFVPKGSVEVEAVSVAPNANLNPLSWIEMLTSFFYSAAGVPEFIVGSGKQFTDAAVKTKYLAWEQTIAEAQLELMQQVLSQLGLVIQLKFPASLKSDMLSSQAPAEDKLQVNPPEMENQQPAAEPNDTKLEMEGNR